MCVGVSASEGRGEGRGRGRRRGRRRWSGPRVGEASWAWSCNHVSITEKKGRGRKKKRTELVVDALIEDVVEHQTRFHAVPSHAVDRTAVHVRAPLPRIQIRTPPPAAIHIDEQPGAQVGRGVWGSGAGAPRSGRGASLFSRAGRRRRRARHPLVVDDDAFFGAAMRCESGLSEG